MAERYCGIARCRKTLADRQESRMSILETENPNVIEDCVNLCRSGFSQNENNVQGGL